MPDLTADLDLLVEDPAASGGRRRLNVTDFDSSLIYVQSSASDTWVIVHGLGKYPAVSVIDSGGSYIVGDITYDSLDQLTLRFAQPFSGKASLT